MTPPVCTREKIRGAPCTAKDTANENQVTAYVDAEGYVVRASSTRAKVNALAFLDVIAATRGKYPLPEIVMPAGYARHIVTGRGMLVEEIAQHDGYYVLGSTYVPPTMERVA